MSNTSKIAIAMVLASFSLATPALACDLTGNWTGPVTFINARANLGTKVLNLTVKPDCSYDFVVPGVVSTPGNANKNIFGGGYGYLNKAGSYGTMTLGQDKLRIVQGQGTYTAELSRKKR